MKFGKPLECGELLFVQKLPGSSTSETLAELRDRLMGAGFTVVDASSLDGVARIEGWRALPDLPDKCAKHSQSACPECIADALSRALAVPEPTEAELVRVVKAARKLMIDTPCGYPGAMCSSLDCPKRVAGLAWTAAEERLIGHRVAH